MLTFTYIRIHVPQLASVLLLQITSLSAHSVIITQNQFLGFSNIVDNDISCVAPVASAGSGSCKVFDGFNVAQAGTSGPAFNAFDSALGTLNNVTFSYNLQTGGVWISRPESSLFSASTDFNYVSGITLSLDDLRPGLSGTRASVDSQSRSASFNYRVNQVTDSWSVFLTGSQNFDPYLFTYIDGVTTEPQAQFVTATLHYNLFAKLNGQGLDCEVGTAACGTTNRIIYLNSTMFSLTYDYTPHVVPIPGAAWLLASGLLSLAGVARIRGGKNRGKTTFSGN